MTIVLKAVSYTHLEVYKRQGLYSPDVIEKLQEIKQNIRVKYGVQTSNKIIKNILSAIKEIRTYENKGVSVASMKMCIRDRNKQQLAISFHPELDGDNRLHQYFAQMVSSSLNKEK